MLLVPGDDDEEVIELDKIIYPKNNSLLFRIKNILTCFFKK
jgi:hypothetical protein